MSRRLVPGDPASISAGGSSLGRVGVRLEADAEAVRAAYRMVGTDWGGRRSLAVRQAGAALADEVTAAGREAAGVARALQDHATQLADLQAQLRALVERADAVGLELRDGTVAPSYGLIGEADAAAEAAREQTRAAVAADLDRLVTLAARRRSELTRTLARSQAYLSAISGRLRQG